MILRISIHQQEDGHNQVRFYLIHEDGEYWFGGLVIDTTGYPDGDHITALFCVNNRNRRVDSREFN
jgi:hypothetical protein